MDPLWETHLKGRSLEALHDFAKSEIWFDVDLTPLSEDDLSETIRELVDVAAKWRNIGIQLGIRDSQLEAIQLQRGSPLDCLRQMLATWLLKNYNVERFGEPTWMKLVEAVNHMAGGGNPTLATNIAKNHGGKLDRNVSMGQIRKLQQEKEKLQYQQEECGKESRGLQQQQLQIRNDETKQMDQQQIQQLGLGLKQATCQHIQQVQHRDDAIAVRCFVTERDVQLQELSQQLAASEQVATELRQNLQLREKNFQELQEEIQQLQLKLRENTMKRDELLQQLVALQNRKLSLNWILCKAAPHKMRRGSAAVCGNMAYFRPAPSNQVVSCNLDTEEWFTLTECPREWFTLVFVDSLLTAVGGMKPGNYTNTLLSLVEKGRKKTWVEHFPPMPTKRALTAVICSGNALVVAGGWGEGGTPLNTVEVMDTDTLKWSTATSLPHTLSDASATVCGDSVYVVGGHDQHDATEVLTCSLSSLRQSLTPRGAEMISSPLDGNHPVWYMIADLPVKYSTCVTVNGQLLAVGGQHLYDKVTNNVYAYNTETNSWEVISNMPTPRRLCLVVVFPGNKLMVVGGETDATVTDKVEIGSID